MSAAQGRALSSGSANDSTARNQISSITKKYAWQNTTKPWATLNPNNYETCRYERIGNVVHFTMTAVFQAGSNYFVLEEQNCPYGYRPVNNVYSEFIQTASGDIVGYGRLLIAPSGVKTVWISNIGFSEHNVSASWFTSDSFP